MQKSGQSFPLRSLELNAQSLTVHYRTGQGHQARFEPVSFRVGLEGFYIPWEEAPRQLDSVTVEWADNPFMTEAFSTTCRVARKTGEGVDLLYTSPPPTAFEEWFRSVSGILFREAPDAAVRTSQLYTLATVVSACGLFFGAMAILLPIVVGDRGWVDGLAKTFLIVMVVSIGAFAVIRLLAGRQEVRAIGQGRG